MWQLLAVPILVIASTICFVWPLVSPSRRSFIGAFSVTTAALAVSLWLVWSFRDGMGPDAVTTTGFKALQHFWHGAVVPMVTWLTFAIIVTARVWLWLRQRSNNSSTSTLGVSCPTSASQIES